MLKCESKWFYHLYWLNRNPQSLKNSTRCLVSRAEQKWNFYLCSLRLGLFHLQHLFCLNTPTILLYLFVPASMETPSVPISWTPTMCRNCSWDCRYNNEQSNKICLCGAYILLGGTQTSKYSSKCIIDWVMINVNFNNKSGWGERRTTGGRGLWCHYFLQESHGKPQWTKLSIDQQKLESRVETGGTTFQRE